VVIATVSVVYKYSFTQVDARDSVLVYDTGILSSLILLGEDASDNGIGISYNLLDVTNTADYLSTVGLSSILVGPAYNSSNPVFFRQDLIFDPSVNASLAAQLVRGVLYDCNVESYARNTINIANDTWVEVAPIIPDIPPTNGWRFAASASYVIDISSSNGTLQVMYGNTTKFTEQPHPQYDGMSTVKIQGCTG
jgi:hypothetical protein